VDRLRPHEPGWARIAQGEVDEGVEELRRGLAMYDTSGAKLWRPHYVGLLGHALATAKHVDDALNEGAAALAVVERTGEYWCVAELHLVAGELLIMQAAGAGDGFSSLESSSSRRLSSSAESPAESHFHRLLRSHASSRRSPGS
jgi:predicted ATPase